MRIGTALAALLALTLAACGGGDLGSTPISGPSGPALSKVLVASADVDADGRGDLIELDRDGIEAPTCWQAREDGTFVRQPAWQDHPAVRAIQADARTRSDADLVGDEGIHRARGTVSGARPLPYAVLHVGTAREEVLGAPVVEELSPAEGRENTLVLLQGTDLAAAEETTSVTFDGVSAEVLLAWPRFVVAVVPAALPLGDVPVVLTRGEETSAAVTFTVVATPTPLIERLRPEPLVTGTLAVIHGRHLGTPLDDVTVALGATDVPRFVALGRRLLFEVPDTATEGPLVVTVNGVSSAPLAVTISDTTPAPSITSLSPASASPGSLFRIEGTHLLSFGESVRVHVGDEEAALFAVSHDALVAIVPANAVDGNVVVTVGDRASAGSPFTVVARGLPTITALDPTSGHAGASILIQGSDLYDLSAWRPGRFPPLRDPFGDVEVRFGDTRAFFVFPTTEGLRVRVPFRAETGDVTVRVGIDTSNPVPFTVTE